MKLKLILVSLGAVLFSIGFSISAHAQISPSCNVGEICSSDADCQPFTDPNPVPPGGCPSCIGCDLDSASPTFQTCQPLNRLCDDGSDCTSDFCFYDDMASSAPPNNGCQYTALAVAFPPPDDLPIECYICEPTANGVLVDNGICDRTAGEDCSNSPDCAEDAVACGTPPIPPINCQPIYFLDPAPVCQDGDRCTDDICIPAIVPGSISPQGPPSATCSNPEKTCQPDSDGCCPAGCDGPDPATTTNICRDVAGAPIPNCDADCWFPQVCGDALVQPPETCDDDANAGDAGISPSGAIVSDEQCRDLGAPAECTYCGDGILQAAVEECEVGLIGACGTTGVAGECDLTTCQCEESICVTGSGNIWDEIRPACANCSLSQDAISQGWIGDYQAFFFLAGIFGLGLVWRRLKAMPGN